MAALTRFWLRFVVWLNARLKSASVRLTRWTGKSPVPIHPKHLAGDGTRTDWYLEHIALGQRVLDCGCGVGAHTLRAADRAGHVVGLELDAIQVRRAHRLAQERAVANSLFALADLSVGLPIRNAAVDVVLLLDVIEHLHARRALLEDLRRVLVPDGRLLLSVPNADTRWKRRLRRAGLPTHADPDHKIEYNWDGLCAELGDAGFAVVSEPTGIVLDTPWAGLIDLVGGFSLTAYRWLMQRKVDAVVRRPGDTTGWRLVCRKARP